MLLTSAVQRFLELQTLQALTLPSEQLKAILLFSSKVRLIAMKNRTQNVHCCKDNRLFLFMQKLWLVTQFSGIILVHTNIQELILLEPLTFSVYYFQGHLNSNHRESAERMKKHGGGLQQLNLEESHNTSIHSSLARTSYMALPGCKKDRKCTTSP